MSTDPVNRQDSVLAAPGLPVATALPAGGGWPGFGDDALLRVQRGGTVKAGRHSVVDGADDVVVEAGDDSVVRAGARSVVVAGKRCQVSVGAHSRVRAGLGTIVFAHAPPRDASSGVVALLVIDGDHATPDETYCMDDHLNFETAALQS